jgi:hypothetical protein
MNRLKESYSGCMNCGGKVKMKSGGKWIQSAIKKPGSFTAQANKAGMSVPAFRNKVLSNKSAYSATTVKRANLAKTLAGMRKGEEGMITRKGVKDVINYASRVEPRGITTESSMGMPVAPNTIESPANWYNESTWDKAQAENAARPVASAPVTPATTKGGSEKVRAYQEMLRSKGYDIAADGAWGPQTQKAYEAYIKSKTTAAKTVPKTVAAAQKTNSQFKITASDPYMRTSSAGNAGYTDNTRSGNFDAVSRKTADKAEYARKVGTIRQTPGKKVYPK